MSSRSSEAAGEMPAAAFSKYEWFIVALLAFLQFTVVVDFMILSPLGAMLLKELNVSTAQFGVVVSGYAIAAGVSGLLAAGFADRFDRKKLLLFFYAGFVVGTLLCAMAPNYQMLLAARIFTGFFGGVISSVSMAIVADVFPLERRGRVMGYIQSSFSAAQVLGLPAGLWLATHFGWHSGFLMIVAVSAVVGLAILVWMKPITAHLSGGGHRRSPLDHMLTTAAKPQYWSGFAATLLLTTSGFMLMPFASTFSVNNLGLTLEQLPLVYMVTGVFSLVSGPLLGRLSDVIGKYKMLLIATVCGVAIILIYVRLGVTPIWEVIGLNIILYMTVSARLASASALTSGVPDLVDRGAYMSISSSLQQFAGGVASWVAGLIVHQPEAGEGPLQNYPELGWIVAACMLMCAVLMYRVHLIVETKRKSGVSMGPPPEPEPLMEG